MKAVKRGLYIMYLRFKFNKLKFYLSLSKFNKLKFYLSLSKFEKKIFYIIIISINKDEIKNNKLGISSSFLSLSE